MAKKQVCLQKALLALLLALLMMAANASVSLATDGELVKNGDFSKKKSGWYKTSWIASGNDVDVSEGVLTIHSEHANDVRFRQDLHLAAEQIYRLSAEIQVQEMEREGIAGAWVGLDQTNAKMQAADDQTGWQPVELLIQTPEGGNVSLCLALGDYGSLAQGKVMFRNISIAPAAASEADSVLEIQLPHAKEKVVDENEDPDRILLSRSLSKVFFSVLASVLVYLVYMWSKRCSWILPKTQEISLVIIVLLLGFIVRIAVTMTSPGYVNDTNTFAAWASRMSELSPSAFYSEEYFCDYPPGMLYLLWFGNSIARLLGFVQVNAGLGLVCLFLPILLCDMGLVVLLWRYARKRIGNMIAFGLLLILAFQPVFIYDTAAWHQVDAVLGLLLAVTFVLLEKEKRLAAAAVFGLAILMKPQALMFGPVFALPYLKLLFTPKKRLRGVVDIIVGALVALAIIFVLSIPFTGNQPYAPFYNAGEGSENFIDKNWLLSKYFATTTSYPYATVNAYNLFMLLGGNFAPETMLLGPLTFQQWATIGLFLVVAASIFLYFSAWRKKIDATYLVAAFLIAGLFTVGPRMHERYSFPLIVFLFLAYGKLKDRSLMPILAIYTTGILANMTLALLSLNEIDLFFQSSSMWVARAVALFQVLCFAYLAIICFDICVKGGVQEEKQGPWHRRRLFAAASRGIERKVLNVAVDASENISEQNTEKTDEPEKAPTKEREKMNIKAAISRWRMVARKIVRPRQGQTVRILEDRFRPRRQKLRWTSFDTVLTVGLTVLYAIVAFFRLGTTDVPESYWRGQDGQEFLVRFEQTETIHQIWSYGGISNGELALFIPGGATIDVEPVPVAAEGGEVAAAEQDVDVIGVGEEVNADGTAWQNLDTIEVHYDMMYRWAVLETNYTANQVRVVCSGDTWLEELVFVNAAGKVVTPIGYDEMAGNANADPASSLAHLFDESNTKPDVPGVLNGMYFDELYHGRTAYEHLHGLQPYENTHPPLGKVFIMIGIALFGMNPLGWRCVGTLFGVLMVPIFYVFGKRLLKNSYAALFTTILFTFDFMHFVQTRIATIDVYGVFFILLMYYFMFEYWQMNFYRDGVKKTLRPLALSGLFFGLGAASKWICIYAGGGLAVLLFFSLGKRLSEYIMARSAYKRGEPGARYMVEKTAPFFSSVGVTALLCVLMFVLVPLIIYLLSYIPYMLVKENPYSIKGIVEVQQNMFRYHANLTARHPYESEWWTWPLDIRPIFYYQARMLPSDQGGVISAFGNPVVWWLGLFSVVVLIVRAAYRRRLDNTTIFLLVGLLAQFLPWTVITRATFIYHYFASVPFIVLSTGYLFIKWQEKWRGAYKVAAVVAGVAVLVFFIYYPALSGLPASREFLDALRLFPTWTW